MNVEEFLQDVFNDARHHFGLPEAQWDQPFGTYRAAQVVMTLLYFAAFFAFASGVWIWLFLPTVLAAVVPVAGLVGMGCAVSGLRVLGSDTDTKVLGPLSFAPDYFMPYSVCPGCGVEALHWMAEPDLEAILAESREQSRKLKVHAQQVRQWQERYEWREGKERGRYPATGKRDFPKGPPYKGPKMPPLLAMAMAFGPHPRDLDVVRTCRDCGHSWGQRAGGLVMPTEVIAEADAPTLRAPNFKD